jgi:hypothetical protein
MHPPDTPEELGGAVHVRLARTHWCMQVEVFLEVVTLDISMPLAVALNGGVTVFPTSTAVDFLPKVHHLVAGHWRVVLHRQACTWQQRGRLRHRWCMCH